MTWGKKLGHWAKSKEELVNCPEVTFLKQSSWILLKMFVLMISRSSLKLSHLGSKSRSPDQIKGNLVNTPEVTFFKKNHHEYCSKCSVLMISRSSSKLGHLESETPVPQIYEGFRATTNNSEENIVRSIGTFTTKQFFTEKWKTERRMRKSLRLPPHLEWATHFRNKRSIGMKFPHAYAYLPFVSCVKVRRKCPNTPLVCNHLRMTA